MKSLIQITAALLLLASSAFAGKAVNTSGATGIALQGYDPVAFFTEGKLAHGNPAIQATHEGATYLFSKDEHQKLFKANPSKYAPQFGGYCAYGISVNALFPVDIDTWQIREGKLYLNLNPQILEAFNQDFETNLAKAHENWPELVGASDADGKKCSHCRTGGSCSNR